MHLITNRPGKIPGVTEYDLRRPLDTRRRMARYRDLNFNITAARYLRAVCDVRRLVRRLNPDVLHLHTLYYPAYLGIYTRFHPMVVTPWDGDVVVHQSTRSRWHKWLVKIALQMADLITVDSEELRDACLSYGRLKGYDKLHVVQWGVDLETFEPMDGATLRSQLGLPPNAPVVLSTRHLASPYNVDVIIKTVPFVLREFPSAQFIFLYLSGALLREYKELTDMLGVSESVHFLGSVAEYADLAEYYGLADVYVSVSSWDTTSVSLLEAMACGAPPIVGDLPSLREWVTDGYNGLAVPLRDVQATAGAIVRMLADENLRKRFAQFNLELVRLRADHEKEMSRMEQLYYSVIGKRKTGLAPS